MISQIMKIPGLVEKEELELMGSVMPTDAKVIVEIGSLYGRTNAYLASIRPEARVYAVENFSVSGSDTRPYFVEKIMPKFANIKLIEASSRKACYEFTDLPIDFLFIDGDHQDDGIQADCRDWLPKVRSGGVVAFHDYNNYMFPSIQRRVEEFTQNWKFLGQAGSLVIKEKL